MSRKIPETVQKAIFVVGMFAGGIGLYYGVEALRSCAVRHESGTSEGSTIVGGARVALTYDRVGTRSRMRWRLAAIDLATGTVVTRFFDVPLACVPATDARAWCELRIHDNGSGFAPPAQRIELVDLHTLDTITTLDAILANAHVGTPEAGYRLFHGAAIWQLLHDGRIAIVDPATLAVTTSATVPYELVPHVAPVRVVALAAPTAAITRTHVELGGVALSTGGGPHSPIVRGAIAAEGEHATTTYESPAFAIDAATGAPLGIDGDPIVLHRTAGKLELSRIRADGSPAWTAPLAARAENVTLAGPLLIVVGSDEDARVCAFDAQTGAPRWSVAF